MNIILIVGGMNEPSNSNFLADTFIAKIKGQDASVSVTKFRLKDTNFEHFNLGHYEVDCTLEPEFCRLRDAVLSADGMVIASPIWNFGVPAHLKNLIDRMGSFALDKETRSKGVLNGLPVYFIFTGGAPLPAWKGLMSKTTSFVSQALRYFGASPIDIFFEGKSVQGKGQFGLVVDKRTERLNALGKEADRFYEIVKEYKKTGKAPLKQRATNAIMNLGEKILKKIF